MGIVHMLADAARRKGRAAAISFVALICLLAGLAFLTSALWMVLAAWQGALFAAQVLGAGFCALAFILFAVASITSRPPRRRHRSAPYAEDQSDALVKVIEGFLMGLDAGRRSSRPRRKD